MFTELALPITSHYNQNYCKLSSPGEASHQLFYISVDGNGDLDVDAPVMIPMMAQ